jgi:hypothetical protein
LIPPGINHDVFLGMHKTNGSKENQFWLIALQMASDFNRDFTYDAANLKQIER